MLKKKENKIQTENFGKSQKSLSYLSLNVL